RILLDARTSRRTLPAPRSVRRNFWIIGLSWLDLDDGVGGGPAFEGFGGDAQLDPARPLIQDERAGAFGDREAHRKLVAGAAAYLNRRLHRHGPGRREVLRTEA